MSKALIEGRQERINDMREMGKRATEEVKGFFPTDKFIALFCMKHGVREQLARQYFNILVRAEKFQVDAPNFRSLEAALKEQD